MYDLILLAAGKSKRFDKSEDKTLVRTYGKPLISTPLKTFHDDKRCRNIVIVIREDLLPNVEEIVKTEKFDKVQNIIIGGDDRKKSLQKGIQQFIDKEDLLAVHSITYPFVSVKELYNLYFASVEEDGAVLGRPLEESVKITDDRLHIVDTESRVSRWITHAPTITRLKHWQKAYAKLDQVPHEPTDEAAILAQKGVNLQIVPDFRSNQPIYTTYEWEMFTGNYPKTKQPEGLSDHVVSSEQ